MLNFSMNRKFKYFLLMLVIMSFLLVMTNTTTVVPTINPSTSFKPTIEPSFNPTAPTIKPSSKPAKPARKLIHIYGDEDPVDLTDTEKQWIVGSLTVALLVLMAFDFTGPEILFLIALMVCCLTQILTISETLSGKK